eukprot:TRINITY_DN4193_c0_g1_i11.p1 TRINITY_DN4193_c0_g1~~TRINITY_DN4193_c0_g1_i11.p1  ORF type:complete len:123 (+),score=19.66 TRINITY_DN4193_c0_g1_i11:105-473(+)
MGLLNASKLVKKHCPEIWKNLKILRIDFKFFALRWVILLLSQEFSVEDTQILWDLLLTTKLRFAFINYLILGLLLNIQKELMSDDFSEVMKLLQGASKRIAAIDLKMIALKAYKDDMDAGEI